MSAVWATIVGLAGVSAAIKASGPVVLGGRPLPVWLARAVALLAPALLAALVLVETVGGPSQTLSLDARALGLAAAAAVLAVRPSIVAAVVAAAVVAAIARQVG